MNSVVEAIQNGDLNEIMNHMVHNMHHQTDQEHNHLMITSLEMGQEGNAGSTNEFCHGMGMVM
jgi:hypothetical protein